jgi:GT2 family glycosyltransferase
VGIIGLLGSPEKQSSPTSLDAPVSSSLPTRLHPVPVDSSSLARWPRGHAERLEQSRRLLLDAIACPGEITLVRTVGNRGDDLIHAGTRRLLAEVPHREIALSQAESANGDTAVLAGGGAWCAAYHELMPRTLAVLESRFARVVVFPSSFDLSVPLVKQALSRTRALVFAREPVSFDQIRDTCDARLGHDCAFFFDFSPHPFPGAGVLHAYRTDREAAASGGLPPGNRDVSVECESLDEWLWTISRHELIRTDRAHVMIAGALLGRAVEYRPSAYHKVPAIAEWALSDFPVRPARDEKSSDSRLLANEPARASIPGASAGRWQSPGLDDLRARIRQASQALGVADPESQEREPRVTIVLLTRDRPERVLNAIRSIRDSADAPCRVLVLGNGASADDCDRIENALARDFDTDFLGLETNVGCAGGRQFALNLVTTEYVLYLDDDAELFPATIPRLVADLDSHPEALASGARVVLPSGRLQFCGGSLEERHGLLRFDPMEASLPLEEPLASGACDWVPGTAFLVRRAGLVRFPIDTAMAAYYEDNEWCYRVRRSESTPFRRCAHAFVLHHQVSKERSSSAPEELARVVPYVQSIARFYQAHGMVLDAIFGMVPELRSENSESDAEAAREFLEIVLAKGPDWMLSHWLAGDLHLLFRGELGLPRRRQESELHRIRTSRWWNVADRYWKTRNRILGLLRRESP